MNKTELAKVVAKEVDLTVAQTLSVIDRVVDSIAKAVNDGDTVTIKDFGTFEKVLRQSRTGVGPTGVSWTSEARNVPVFRPGRGFRERIA